MRIYDIICKKRDGGVLTEFASTKPRVDAEPTRTLPESVVAFEFMMYALPPMYSEEDQKCEYWPA